MQEFQNRRRYKLELGKFQIKRVDKHPLRLGLQMALELPGLGLLICTVPASTDVREGDLLTLYTEVLAGDLQ